ncbi:MAG: 2-C-methyl-D-erythritol 2,4-cyclodiphosphate synthase, partial [Bacteroidia bacterium]|nr:2-C-methyl-D-erythritol 2,4-cyclodiphosphate synthase [Bacteroidia bacterium]
MEFPYRIGFGVDVHQLIEGREFWLGGIKLSHTKGALGHSDADVLIHAICDALLGAAALGDIGVHFPDTDNQYKNIDSKILLKHTVELLRKTGFEIGNIDTSLLLEKPKIKPYLPQMINTLSNVMSINENQLSIKATTNEKMGYVGREEGVCAYATALIY